MQLFLKIFSGMTNSVDPDQTAPFFSYAIFVRNLVYKKLGHLPYINSVVWAYVIQ